MNLPRSRTREESWEENAPQLSRMLCTVTRLESLKCDVIILQIFPFEPLNLTIYTAAVRTRAKYQITSINESEDREV